MYFNVSFIDDLDSRRKEAAPARQERLEPSPVPAADPEQKPDTSVGKRSAEESPEHVPEAKKPCVKEPPLEDDLSEISDDADEILNRDEVSLIKFIYKVITLLRIGKFV